jgi:stage III sporulation protein AD
MEILQVVVFCFAAVVALRLLRQEGYTGYAVLLSVLVGVLVFLYVVQHLRAVLTALADLTAGASVNFLFLDTLLKVVGIAYIAEFGSQVCRDAGEGMVASKVELAGKILILLLAVPILLLVLESIMNFLP